MVVYMYLSYLSLCSSFHDNTVVVFTDEGKNLIIYIKRTSNYYRILEIMSISIQTHTLIQGVIE